MSLTADIADDFATVVDGLQSLKLRRRDGSVLDVENVLRRAVSTRQAAASDGKYTSDDVAFHFPAAALPAQPELGATLLQGVNEWRILEVSSETLDTRYRCVCRNLAVVEGLDTLVTIQEAAYAKGPSGAAAASWSDKWNNVRGKLQIETRSAEEADGARQTVSRGTIWLAQELPITRDHRVVVGGVPYRVEGVSAIESITDLLTLEVVRDLAPGG